MSLDPTSPVVSAVLSTVLSGLGIAGAIGILLVPLRAWTLLVRRRIWAPILLRSSGIALAALPLCAIAMATWLGVDSLPRVHRCLMDSLHCSATGAGGMLALARFGVGVVVVEISWALAGLIQRFAVRQAT